MFFRRRKRHPMSVALLHMQAATRILDRHWRDRFYEPTILDLARARTMEQMLFRLAEIAGEIASHLERRFAGGR